MLLRLLSSLAASAAVALFAWSSGEAAPPLDAMDAEALASQAQCLACHTAPEETVARLRSLGAPSLADIGARVAPDGLRAWLRGGHAARTGSRMPELLHALPATDRREAVEDLTHFLASLGGPFEARAARPDAWRIEEGATLFARLACAACHPDGALEARALASKTDLPTLAEFLRDPFAQRPAGGMPDFALTTAESEALAAYLLRAQHAAGPAREDLAPGVRWEYFEYRLEGGLPPDLAAISMAEPTRTGVSNRIALLEGHRSERFAYRFEGWLALDAEESIRFGLNSDDGSQLWVDDELVVDNDGHHAPASVEATVLLAAGMHRVEVKMFEAEGGETLEAWIVRGGVKAPLGAEQLVVRAPVYEPLGFKTMTPDPQRVERGFARFAGSGCGNCHGGIAPLEEARPQLAWEILDPEKGCLADSPSAASADYGFDVEQRKALRALVAQRAELRKPLSASERVRHDLTRMQCTACHTRAGAGGPSAQHTASFTGEGDVGDEGRIPPPLDGVGAKLRPDAIAAILEGRGGVRPYLHARMPRFAAEQTRGLAAALDEADWRNGEDQPPEFDPALVEAGRLLAGNGGLNCVQCHPVAGHAASGMQAMDLTAIASRLDAAWFRAWMENPLAMRKGTRMPVFFAGGRSIAGEILGGDARRQIDALWAWLSLGSSLPLPDGLVMEEGAYALVPTSRPIYFGAFMEGGSPRVMNVGFPERVHLSFDFEHVRLMQVWRGDFFNAAGTWNGRAGALERPAGEAVRLLPQGPAFARLDTPDAAWPTATGASAGWRSLGHRRDAQDRPTFRYHCGEFYVEESVEPEYAEGGAVLVRRFTVQVPSRENWTLRAGVAGSWSRARDGWWESEDGMRLQILLPSVSLRTASGAQELLVDLPTGTTNFEVRMSW
ncbi:MAG: c-type cytochrome [Planctomycetota bacterium]|nr:c-type cytochrome [Planctomycetota bacterium]